MNKRIVIIAPYAQRDILMTCQPTSAFETDQFRSPDFEV